MPEPSSPKRRSTCSARMVDDIKLKQGSAAGDGTIAAPARRRNGAKTIARIYAFAFQNEYFDSLPPRCSSSGARATSVATDARASPASRGSPASFDRRPHGVDVRARRLSVAPRRHDRAASTAPARLRARRGRSPGLRPRRRRARHADAPSAARPAPPRGAGAPTTTEATRYRARRASCLRGSAPCRSGSRSGIIVTHASAESRAPPAQPRPPSGARRSGRVPEQRLARSQRSGARSAAAHPLGPC